MYSSLRSVPESTTQIISKPRQVVYIGHIDLDVWKACSCHINCSGRNIKTKNLIVIFLELMRQSALSRSDINDTIKVIRTKNINGDFSIQLPSIILVPTVEIGNPILLIHLFKLPNKATGVSIKDKFMMSGHITWP